VLILDGICHGNGCPHTVTNEEDFKVPVLLTYFFEERPDVAYIVGESVNVAPQSIRFTVASIVKTTDCVSSGNKIVDKVRVAASVFSEPMYYHQNCLGVLVRQPILVEQIKAFGFFECTFYMFHYSSTLLAIFPQTNYIPGG
jgi:hypothetical protein